MGRARYGDRAGFGVRVEFCAVATVLLMVGDSRDLPAEAVRRPGWKCLSARDVMLS